MLDNYIMLAWRHVRKRKGYTLINVCGLALGLACCLLIALYVQDERSFDAFHEYADRIVRVVTDIERPNGVQALSTTSGAVAPALVESFPEVEQAVRVAKLGFFVYRADADGQPTLRFKEDNLLVADSTLFDIFSFPMLAGDPSVALDGVWNIVLTESTARRYFGEQSAVGQTLVVEDMGGFFPGNPVFTVTGVIADVRANAHFNFDLIIPMAAVKEVGPPGAFTNWLWTDIFTTYALLRSPVDHQPLQSKLADFVERSFGDDMRAANQLFSYTLEPLRTIYLHSKRAGFARQGSLTNVYIFSGVALFILLIACINFINLATARSAERAKEVGMRKVVGAPRQRLVVQFLVESIVMSLMATLLALVLVEVSLPAFRALADKPLAGRVLINPMLMLAMFGGAAVVGTLAGLYPAVVLSCFQPITVLRGTYMRSRKGVWMRKSLVVFQLSASMVLIIGTLIVFAQVQFMQGQALGFTLGSETEQLVTITFDGDPRVNEQLTTVKQELLRHPNVSSVSAGVNEPGGMFETVYTEIENLDRVNEGGHINSYVVDADFLAHYDMELVAGRFFQETQPEDRSETLVVNEAMVRALGYRNPEDILNKPFRKVGREGVVIGVIKDFHYRSLQEEVAPLTISFFPQARFVSARLSGEALPQTLASLQETWRSLAPHIPFTYSFLDESYNQQYATEERFGHVFQLFALLAISIACLGLFGLASLTIQQRTKEVGIRKVLGASVAEVVVLLAQGVGYLVLGAFVLATPLAYFIMKGWLDTFAYRVPITPSVFLLVGGMVLILAVSTISLQTIRAARANPVESLRYE